MRDEHGFDEWAGGYDASVRESAERGSYPFAGYGAVLDSLYRTVTAKAHPRVLDLGFGTATLTGRLYDAGAEIWGQDFSAEMIQRAQKRMPDARLFHKDFSEGLADELAARRFDFITATYSLHHLAPERQKPFLAQLRSMLVEGGAILIGDVLFETEAAQDACRKAAGAEWDDEEHYLVFSALKDEFPTATFTPISFCAGIISIT